jgi:hypothetical protein
MTDFLSTAQAFEVRRRVVTSSNCLDCQIVVRFRQNGRLRLRLDLLDEPFHMNAVNRGLSMLIALKEDLLAIG